MPSPAALTAFVRFYTSNFDRRPVATLTITNGLLSTIADVLAQTSQILLATPQQHLSSPEFLPPPPSFDPVRTLRFAAYGAAMGPLIGAWMRALERFIPMRAGAAAKAGMSAGGGQAMGSRRQTIQLVKRVAADQLVMAPFGMGLFITAMGVMEGKSRSEIGDKFAEMYMPALISNWKVWPLCQAINFRLMPLPYRVPFQSTCGIAWTVYLSLLNARSDKLEEMHA